MYSILCFLLALAVTTLCASSPPAGAITVGPGGKYPTLTKALADTSSKVYFIYATTLKERVVITRPGLTIYGQTSNALTYANNRVTITNNIPANKAGSNEASATVSVQGGATDLKLYNLNIANTFGVVRSMLGLLREAELTTLAGLPSNCFERWRHTVRRLWLETHGIPRYTSCQ